MSNIERQISKATERWRRTERQREIAMGELRKKAEGKPADWRRVEAPSRVQRRLERLGQDEAAEAIVDGASFEFDPLERVLGASQLTGIEFFERGLIASRAVARIEIRGRDGRLTGYGSGVLVSPRLLMTNNHVLDSDTRAAGSIAQFEYLTSAAGIPREPRAFRLRPDDFFVTDPDLDFSIVAVEAKNASGDELKMRGWCPLIAGSGKALVGERVNIIQHPGGERMQITVRDNTILAVIEDFLQYEADTEPGSSGSPVFNEQWEMAALHHAGVPKRDRHERILMRNGQPWTGRSEDVDRIDWIANEGTRISRIVAFVNGLKLDVWRRALWEEAFVPPRPLDLWDLFQQSGARPLGQEGAAPPATVVREEDGTTSWYFRLTFGPVGGDDFAAASAGIERPPSRGDTPPPEPVPAAPAAPPQSSLGDLADQVMQQFGHAGPYYDASEDRQAAEAYWAGLDWTADAPALFDALHRHLEASHAPRHSYAKARHEFLYPSIDLHPDGLLRSLYSGMPMDPREVISAELAAVAPLAASRGVELDVAGDRALEMLLESDELWRELEDEAQLALNCEHVVCQSWFDKDMPMRSDLHHLFACEPGCNSFRSNIPYWQFSPEEEAERDLCGRREGNKFEPEAGKGPAARATLYFLVRYPGEVGESRQEMTRNRLGVVLDWHRNNPVDAYERHRNWLTQKAQGNRNPFVDRPEAAREALLRLGFA